ncbi:MAG: outer spore coat protein CotE [Paenisporosarcina sp.]
MKYLRQIVTKAVVAKGKKKAEASETLRPPNNPSSILGCWVINHTHQAKKHGKFVEVTGKYDINVWYAHHDHSKTSVFSETVPYRERIKLSYRDGETTGLEEVHVRILQQPNCTEAIITPDGEQFEVTVERELLAEVVGETTVCISVHPSEYEEEWVFQDESSSSSSTSSFKESKESSSF